MIALTIIATIVYYKSGYSIIINYLLVQDYIPWLLYFYQKHEEPILKLRCPYSFWGVLYLLFLLYYITYLFPYRGHY